MAKSTKTKKNKPTSKAETKSKKPKGKKKSDKYLDYQEAVDFRAAFKEAVAPSIYKDYITYTIEELRSFIDAAEHELENHDADKSNHAIAFFPVIELNNDNRINVGLTSCLIVKSDTENGKFKHQFNKQLDNVLRSTDPLNPFNGNGTDLEAYNHGQGHPFIPTPRK